MALFKPALTNKTAADMANVTATAGQFIVNTTTKSIYVDDADGTRHEFKGTDSNTTYSNATTATSGLMSFSDKAKLDGIASGANKYTLPAAGSALGGVKSGGDVTISSGVITVNDDSHNHTIANVDNLQDRLNEKMVWYDTSQTPAENYLLACYSNTEYTVYDTNITETDIQKALANIGNLQTSLTDLDFGNLDA